VVVDLDGARIPNVADDRQSVSLAPFFQGLSDCQRSGITAVAMNMWEPYRKTLRMRVPDADAMMIRSCGVSRRRSPRPEVRISCESAPGIVLPPKLVQLDSLYAVLETLAVIATVARKWAGGTLPKLLWGRSLLYSDRYCSMVRWASVRSIK